MSCQLRECNQIQQTPVILVTGLCQSLLQKSSSSWAFSLTIRNLWKTALLRKTPSMTSHASLVWNTQCQEAFDGQVTWNRSHCLSPCLCSIHPGHRHLWYRDRSCAVLGTEQPRTSCRICQPDFLWIMQSAINASWIRSSRLFDTFWSIFGSTY